MMADSLRRSGETGSKRPVDALTTPIASSTVSVPPGSRSERPRQGRISAVRPVMRCERLSLVLIWTVELAALERVRGAHGIRRGGEEVPAQGDERLDLALVHRGDGVHRVVAGLPRRGEAELLVQRIEEGPGGTLPDPHGAVALDVGVAADAAGAGAGPADMPAEQQQVHQHPDGGHGVAVLGEAHRPAGDHPLRPGDHAPGTLDLLARDTGALDDVLPAGRLQVGVELGEAIGVIADEGVVEHAARRLVLGEHHLHEALEQRDVAVDPHRQVQVGERVAGAEQMRGEMDRGRVLVGIRVGEPEEARLAPAG